MRCIMKIHTFFNQEEQISQEENPAPNKANYFRSERQTLVKLPKSGAIIFGIHTFVVCA